MPVKLIRTSHGTGAKTALVRIEAPVLDELAAGVPAPNGSTAAFASTGRRCG